MSNDTNLDMFASETISTIAMDSTLDSRMSSTKVPQMEILQINYVHPRKKAFIKKPQLHIPHDNMYHPSKNSSNSMFGSQENSPMSKKFDLNMGSATAQSRNKKNLHQHLLPPPTIESWQLLQNSKEVSAFISAYRSSGQYIPRSNVELPTPNSPESTECNMRSDCEKSYSWNYRSKKAQLGIRHRKIAEVDLKSHSDHNAPIENNGNVQKSVAMERVSLPTTRCFNQGDSSSAISKINQMFKSQPSLRLKEPASAAMKEPNLRRRPVSCVVTRGEHYEQCSKLCDTKCKQMQLNFYNAVQKEAKPISRIPKPIHSHNNRVLMSSPLLLTEVNDQLKERVKLIFGNDSSSKGHLSNIVVKPNLKKSLPSECPIQNKSHEHVPNLPLNSQKARNINSFDQKLLKNTRHLAAHYEKVKAERIHIRKRRQSLHIINQLSGSETIGCSNETSTCCKGIQNEKEENSQQIPCTLKMCDSIENPTISNDKTHIKMNDKQRRSPVTSSSDLKVSYNNTANFKKCLSISTREHITDEMKIMDNCSDCTKIIRQKASLESVDLAYSKFRLLPKQNPRNADKLKEIGITSDSQMRLHVDKIQIADPNDVQNFAKKNLIKATTDELLTGNFNNNNSRATKPKQCNIDNDLNNNKHRKFKNLLQRTTAHIDDNWVQEVNEVSDDLDRKPINANDNCVKIFVCNASNAGDVITNNRSPPMSINSSDSHSSSSSAEASGSMSSCADSNTDYQSICGSEQNECCCNSFSLCSSAGIFLNEISNAGLSLSACVSSTNHSNKTANSDKSCDIYLSHASCENDNKVTTAHGASADPLKCDAVSGVFWNNSYCHNDNHCCCSLSSCDDDNCSYYGNDWNDVVEPVNCRTETAFSANSTVAHGNCCEQQQQQKRQHKQNHSFCKSKLDTFLTHRKKLLRKTEVVHELRPISIDGAIDSGVSLNGDIASSPDGSENVENHQDIEARRLKRGHVLTELLETERIYVNEMSSILNGYRDQMQSEEMIHLVPASLQGKENVLFGNLHELYIFHNEIFLKDLENCISTTELVALCFVQRRDTFYRLYSFYCQNIPRSDRLRDTLADTNFFLQECQKRLGHKLPLAAYLLKPVQRITKYQLLLKDLLRFSDSGSCTKELQRALDCMLIVLKCVNDSMHQVAITGFPWDLSQQGELLLQDSFQVWTESKKDIRLRIKPQQRHIFLYQKSMLFCKQTSKPGHNKSTYQFKHHLKMSQIGLTESIRGDTKRFEVWLQGRQEVHTLQAPTIEIKHKWVAEIKRVLLNQLEELKDEKIKQYGLSHSGLRQHTSWDASNIVVGVTHRKISSDTSSVSSNRNSNCSSSGDDNCLEQAITIGNKSTIEKEQQEASAWSSDYSNSEDEMSTMEDRSTPGNKFVTLSDYAAMGHSEVSVREGDTVELLKVGCAGWWYVRVLDSKAEGWAPAAYLDSLNRKSSRYSNRSNEQMDLSKNSK